MATRSTAISTNSLRAGAETRRLQNLGKLIPYDCGVKSTTLTSTAIAGSRRRDVSHGVMRTMEGDIFLFSRHT
jgi:hypothetical protein